MGLASISRSWNCLFSFLLRLMKMTLFSIQLQNMSIQCSHDNQYGNQYGAQDKRDNNYSWVDVSVVIVLVIILPSDIVGDVLWLLNYSEVCQMIAVLSSMHITYQNSPATRNIQIPILLIHSCFTSILCKGSMILIPIDTTQWTILCDPWTELRDVDYDWIRASLHRKLYICVILILPHDQITFVPLEE